MTISAGSESGALHTAVGKWRYVYEPYVHALSHLVQMPLPSFLPSEGAIDDWERSAWTLPG